MNICVASVWVRGVAASFADCQHEDRSVTVDAQRARDQHEAYVAGIKALIEDVRELPADDAFPDCVFIEDTAVVIDHELVVLTHPGAQTRQGEVAAVGAALEEHLEVRVMQAPRSLDGGDVLRIRDRLFIGMSSRSNQEGADFLASVARERGITPVITSVPMGLHLKSACSLADEKTLLFDPAVGLDLSVFDGLGLECIATPEALGANVLALGDRRLLATASAPRSIELLRSRGLEVTVLEASEFHKADGALTCPSLRLPRPGSWCT